MNKKNMIFGELLCRCIFIICMIFFLILTAYFMCDEMNLILLIPTLFSLVCVSIIYRMKRNFHNLIAEIVIENENIIFITVRHKQYICNRADLIKVKKTFLEKGFIFIFNSGLRLKSDDQIVKLKLYYNGIDFSNIISYFFEIE